MTPVKPPVSKKKNKCIHEVTSLSQTECRLCNKPVSKIVKEEELQAIANVVVNMVKQGNGENAKQTIKENIKFLLAEQQAGFREMVEEMRKENRYSKDESWTDEMSTATDGFNEALDQLQTKLEEKYGRQNRESTK